MLPHASIQAFKGGTRHPEKGHLSAPCPRLCLWHRFCVLALAFLCRGSHSSPGAKREKGRGLSSAHETPCEEQTPDSLRPRPSPPGRAKSRPTPPARACPKPTPKRQPWKTKAIEGTAADADGR